MPLVLRNVMVPFSTLTWMLSTGAPADNIQVQVKDGTITLQNTSGTLLFFR